MVWKILATRKPITDPHKVLPKKKFKVVVAEAGTKRFKQELKTADALMVMTYIRYDKQLLQYAQKLKVISTMSVGFDHIDIAYCKSRGIAVTNTPDVLTETTADLTWALILAAARRIVEADIFTRKGKFKGWHPSLYLGRDVNGKTLGVIGAGRIGSSVIQRATGFTMKILYNSPTRKPLIERRYGARRTGLERLIKSSDIIAVTCPLNNGTYHLLKEKHFRQMKKGVIIVNTARGQVIDEKAMIKYLKNGRIFAAGLDVYHDEPKIPGELLKLPNVVLLPHIGSASIETRETMSEITLRNIRAILTNSRPYSQII